jgi:hypothetical protein
MSQKRGILLFLILKPNKNSGGLNSTNPWQKKYQALDSDYPTLDFPYQALVGGRFTKTTDESIKRRKQKKVGDG